MPIHYHPAPAHRAQDYVHLRGLTRENAISADRLRQLGITAASWAADIEAGHLDGELALLEGELAGYCFGDTRSGEIVVLALLPWAEGQGIGRQLLMRVVQRLQQRGHRRLFLGCSADPKVRSYGFYRHLGWRSTDTVDSHQDELLELILG